MLLKSRVQLIVITFAVLVSDITDFCLEMYGFLN